ncbi:MAG: hypothetical protein KA187_00520 [Arenimonas sp.]|nr:hypothetical protein [Arenimonas sp.]MBP6625877.1 hypothetical protein [Arenimonas sp.]
MSPSADDLPTPPARRRRDPEFWIALAALMVSGLAMLSSLVQVGVQRNQERAMVWPHVTAGPSFSGQGFALEARNKGLGPALVRDVQLQLDGRDVADVPALMDALLGPGHGYGWDKLRASDLENTVLAANEAVVLLAVPWDGRIRDVFASGGRVGARICYCSFLDECWISRGGLDHERVDRCPSPPPTP